MMVCFGCKLMLIVPLRFVLNVGRGFAFPCFSGIFLMRKAIAAESEITGFSSITGAV